MSISVFLPIKSQSRRVPNKNFAPFGKYKYGLTELKLEQLLKVEGISEIIVSTDQCSNFDWLTSEERFRKIRLVERDKELALDTALITELTKHAVEVCTYDNILWTHVTSPFCNEDVYNKCIQNFNTKRVHSICSVIERRGFYLTAEGVPVNFGATTNFWPRTQDLDLLYEINSAIFLFNKSVYRNYGNRISNDPELFIMDTYNSLDIDDKADFDLLTLIFNNGLEYNFSSLGSY